MARGIPTDEKLLADIYRHYLADFSAYSDDNKTRSSKIWMPIDIDVFAKRFNCDSDLIFGRLYYHLNGKYGTITAGGDKSDFFAMRIGRDHHCVNFPMLASVLADLQDDRKRFVVSTRIAAISLILSAVSIVLAVYL